MLDESVKTQLATYLAKVSNRIELSASLDGSEAATEMWALLEAVASLSENITLNRDDNADRAPSFSVMQQGGVPRLRFAGVPLGHEFNSFVLALLQVGGHPARQSQAVLDRIRNLPGPLHFESFYSLSCQNCPDVVQALNLMTVINPQITHTAIDGALFQVEVEARGILAVPSVFLNGRPFGQGRMGLEEILSKLDATSAAANAAALGNRAPYDVLVVGGGPAGAAAAIYAARKGIRTGIAGERFGGQVLDTMGIENFISVPHTEGPKLAASLGQHVVEYGIDTMNGVVATKLIPAADPQDFALIQLSNGATLQARAVILATGARWRQLNVPGESEYRNKGVAYCPHCDGPLFKGKRVAVIGGGNSGVEAAIDLAGIVGHVTLIEFDDRLRADAVLQSRLRSLRNVAVITSAQTTEVHGDGKRVTGLSLRLRTSAQTHRVDLDGVFVQIGLLPNTEWLKGTIALTTRGEIEVDRRGATSIPGIFAAGDATTAPYKQIVIAMGDGATAALTAFDHLIRLAPADEVLAA
ncbi:MAG: alkyl hydroperoxide reductase subunit F [Micropepsaceae bacterium]